MKKSLLVVAILAMCAFAQAGIETWSCDDDGDGGIVMNDLTTDLAPTGSEGGIPTYTLSMDGVQNAGTAHVEGNFTVNGDPIVWIMEDVDNNTGFTWTGYQFKVYMDKTFSFTGVTAPFGWSYNVTPASFPNQIPHTELNPQYGYMGMVTFTAGSGYEIPDGDMGTFGVRVKFDGSVSFCTEQTAIPEPATLSILGLGALALFRRK